MRGNSLDSHLQDLLLNESQDPDLKSNRTSEANEEARESKKQFKGILATNMINERQLSLKKEFHSTLSKSKTQQENNNGHMLPGRLLSFKKTNNDKDTPSDCSSQ